MSDPTLQLGVPHSESSDYLKSWESEPPMSQQLWGKQFTGYPFQPPTSPYSEALEYIKPQTLPNSKKINIPQWQRTVPARMKNPSASQRALTVRHLHCCPNAFVPATAASQHLRHAHTATHYLHYTLAVRCLYYTLVVRHLYT
jgi:hypothetical protein